MSGCRGRGPRARAEATSSANSAATAAGMLPSHARWISTMRADSAARRSRSLFECLVIFPRSRAVPGPGNARQSYDCSPDDASRAPGGRWRGVGRPCGVAAGTTYHRPMSRLELPGIHGGPLVADGAMGTALFAAGLPAGEAPEAWLLSEAGAAAIGGVHRGHVDAGARLVLTSSFGANPLRLAGSSSRAAATRSVAQPSWWRGRRGGRSDRRRKPRPHGRHARALRAARHRPSRTRTPMRRVPSPRLASTCSGSRRRSIPGRPGRRRRCPGGRAEVP